MIARRVGGYAALQVLLTLAGVVSLVYGVIHATHPGLQGERLLGLVGTTATALGGAGWLLGPRAPTPVVRLAGVGILAVGGGIVAGLSPFGTVVIGVAAWYAAAVLAWPAAAGLACVGPVAAAVAGMVTGHEVNALTRALIGAVVGLLIGVLRRQRQARIRQDAELALANERAELLAERNRIAREVHDVLAHTLSAVSVQMTALDALVDDGADPAVVRAGIDRTKRLVVEGLAETRRAVHALRDEPVALVDQLTALARADDVELQLDGVARPLPAAAGLALLRVAQEALTNARKHAQDTTVHIELWFGEGRTRVTVTNPAPAGPSVDLANTGGGYGLSGLNERVDLLGGSFNAGPCGSGWRVEAEVPA